MPFRVHIQPVTGDSGPVIETLMRFLGPDSRDRAEQLIATGGVVMKGLNRQAADHIAALLERAGAMAFVEQGESGISAFTVVVLDRASNQPVPGARVEVLGDGETFAAGVSDAAGEASFERFEQLRREAFGNERPEIRVQVQRQGQTVEVVHKPFRWEMFDATDGILRFLVSAAAPSVADPQVPEQYTVHGRVVLDDGEPPADVTVRAYDRDLRSETLLGQTTAGEEGHYEIQYAPTAAEGGEHGGADLRLRAFTQTGRELSSQMRANGLTEVGGDRIFFNAGPEVSIDLVVTTVEIEPSLYERVLSDITPLLQNRVRLADLTAADVRFVHLDTGRALREIAFAADDARLQSRTSMPEAVFFGLGMQNIGDVTFIEEEERPQLDLPTILEHSVDVLMEGIESALEARQIPAALRDQVGGIRTSLETLKETHHVESPGRVRERARAIGELAGLDEDTAAAVARRTSGVASADAPWTALVEDEILEADTVDDVRLTFELAEIGDQNVQLADFLTSGDSTVIDRPIHSARDLAAFDESDWTSILEEHDIPLPEEQTRERYVQKIAWNVERRFPTAVFAHRTLLRDRSGLPNHLEQIQALLESNERVFTRLTSPKTNPDDEGVDTDDKDMQAVLRLARRYMHLGVPDILDASDRDMDEKVQEIERRVAAVDTFFESNPDLDLRTADLVGLIASDDPESEAGGAGFDYGEIDASLRPNVQRQLMAYQRVMAIAPSASVATTLIDAGFSSVYDVAGRSLSAFSEGLNLPPLQAAAVHTQALLDLDHTNFVAGTLVSLLPGIFTSTNVDTIDEDLANRLRELDSYETLFGSQAGCDCAHCRSVFGPLAYFVDLMVFVDQTFLSPAFGTETDHLLHLKTRRPDLWDQLELSCENATQLVPYLDIVNDVLTRYVGRVEALEPQDGESLADAVIARLSMGDRSFHQPVHLPLEEIRLGLDRLGVDVPDVIERAGGDDSARVRAWLSLSSEAMSAVVTSIANDEEALRRRYGLTAAADLTELSVDTLMRATGLDRDALGRLVSLSFVDAGSGDLRIVPVREEEALQPSHEEVRGLTPDRLDRIFRFVRLWRALPWTVEELDHAIGVASRQPGASGLTRETLHVIASLRELQETMSLTPAQVFALVDDIPTQSLRAGEASLYDRLFNPEAFAKRAGRFAPTDPPLFRHAPFDRAPASTTDSDPALPRLLNAFEISEETFVELMTHLRGPLNPFEIVPDMGGEPRSHVELNHQNLTLLYRHALVGRTLDHSVDELFLALDLTQSQVPPLLTGEGEIQSLLDLVTWVRDADLTIRDVAFVEESPSEGLDRTFDLAEAQTFASQLEPLVTFSADVFAEIAGLEEEDRTQLLDGLVAEGVVAEEDAGDRYRLTGAYDSTALPPLPTDVLERKKEAIRGVLNRYLPEVQATEKLSSVLDISLGRLRAVNAVATGTVANPERVLSRTQGLLLTSSSSSGPDLLALLNPLEEALHATEALDLSVAAVAFVAEHPSLFALRPGDAHPIGTEALRRLATYAALERRFEEHGEGLNALLTDDALLQEFAQLGDEDRERLVGALARLVNTPVELARSVLAHLPRAGSAVDTVRAVVDAMDLARILGTSGAGLAQLRSTGFEDLRTARDTVYAALHARHEDEANHDAVLAQIEEHLRGRTRDVLVSHIRARPELNFDDATDLYHYFLLDPEMEGCAQTSRVVAATASLQLYVHRCFMHLEQAADEQVQVYPEPEARDQVKAEWAWRKNYRVWEANRKVFLYPENYLEPDLRDNKTPPFEELEERLMQEDLDEAVAERLYRGYLDRYDEISTLRIAGAYFEPFAEDSSEGTVYVVGRTASQPARFYLRRETGGHWSAWERIDVEILAREVSPLVYLDRLYLFWIETVTKPQHRKGADSADNFVGYRHEITLNFTTQAAEGNWTAPQEVQLPSSLRSVDDPIEGREKPGVNPRDVPGRPFLDKVIAPIHQQTLYPSHFEKNERGWRIPAMRNDYTLNTPLYNRIFPFIFVEPDPEDESHNDGSSEHHDESEPFPEEQVYFRFGQDRENVYRLDVRGRRAHRTEDFPSGSEEFYGGIRVGSVRLVKSQVHLERPEFAPETTEAYLLRAQPFDPYAHYYDAERARLDGFEEVDSSAGHDWLGNVPFESDVHSVNNAPHLWIFQNSRGAALLRQTGYVDLSASRLRTRVPALLQRRLFQQGLWAMLGIDTQLDLSERFLFEGTSWAAPKVATGGGTVFWAGHPFRTYNWEVFFHAPLLIANTLNARGRYEEAERWYNVVFDPTGPEIERSGKEKAYHPNDRNWRFRALHGLNAPVLKDLLSSTNDAYRAYRTDPFNPHAIAWDRPTAYQRGVVMKYIDNLLDWGDTLFTRDTRESINEAMLLYVTAADILGRRPAELGACETPAPAATYDALAADGSFVVTVENLVRSTDSTRPMSLTHVASRAHDDSGDPGGEDSAGTGGRWIVSGDVMPPFEAVDGTEGFTVRGTVPVLELLHREPLSFPRDARTVNGDEALPNLSGLADRLVPFTPDLPAFCIPQNTDLLAYWDRVADRLFKIRNCMNIEGVRRTLALYDPPIDPALLVRARAAGIMMDEVLGGAALRQSPYRFQFLIGKAKEYVSTLRGFGGALLSALEKKDAEELAQLRLVHQQNVQRMTKGIRQQQIEAAQESIRSLEDQRDRVQARVDHLEGKISKGWILEEDVAFGLSVSALGTHTAATVLSALAPPAKMVPDVEVGYASLGGFSTVKYGSDQTGGAAEAAAQVLRDVTTGLNMGAGIATTLGGYERRTEEWEHQRNLAEMELDQLEKDLVASEIRIAIAERELETHELQMEQAKDVYAFYRDRFTNLGLYNWLSSEVRGLYRQAFRMATEMARMAESAYQYERDRTDTYIMGHAWDSERAGLLSGEKLMIQLQEMEKAFLESGRRDYEVDQTFSLGQLDPIALHQLREEGNCAFSLSELAYDLAYPGQYRRRIKSVRLTIPCVTGPYVNVNAKLTLTQSRVRKKAPRDIESPTGEGRLVEEPRSRNVSIATSRAQNDGGVFEISFRGERYMPFEGAGAVSDWKLELPGGFRTFDYDTISDVLVHVSYTAKEDGRYRDLVETKIKDILTTEAETRGIQSAVSLKQQYASSLHVLFREESGDGASPPHPPRRSNRAYLPLLLAR